jgi:CubicO group peptidase (beta-lactamase class C family)
MAPAQRASRIILLLLLSLLLSMDIALASAAPSEGGPPEFAAADAFALAAIDAGEIPSAAYAIARNGVVLHAAAVGAADREQNIPASLETPYALASLSKPITATALLVLRHASGLSLDAPIQELLPALAPEDGLADPLQGVTLARLLHHTAGLGTYAQIHYGDEIATATAQVSITQRPYLRTVQTPGRIAEYSNIGYGLIGDAIAARSGVSFERYLQRSVFTPLAMRNAFVAGAEAHSGAVAYDASLKPIGPLWNDTPGAGNVFASVEDLLRFGDFHLDPSRSEVMLALLPEAQVMAMRRPDSDGAAHPMYGDAWYGQGWYVRGPVATPQQIWHEGGMPGASTLLALYPEQGLVLTVLVNRSDAQPFVHALAGRLLRTAWPEAPALGLDPIVDFAPLSAPTRFSGDWTGAVTVDGQTRSVSLQIDPSGESRLEYASGHEGEPATTVRTFQAIVRDDSLVSAVQGPWRSTDAPDGAAALLLKLSLRDDDTLEGALVAYEGPERLRFLLPFALTVRRVAAESTGVAEER